MPARRSRLAAVLLAAAAPAVAPAADIAGPVDIGDGRRIYAECRGEGAPAVVIVAGAKASAADWTEPAAPGATNVFDAIGEFTRVCAYVPGARRVTDTDSGHEVHKDQPQLVIDSIRDVVEAVRAGQSEMEP